MVNRLLVGATLMALALFIPGGAATAATNSLTSVADGAVYPGGGSHKCAFQGNVYLTAQGSFVQYVDFRDIGGYAGRASYLAQEPVPNNLTYDYNGSSDEYYQDFEGWDVYTRATVSNPPNGSWTVDSNHLTFTP